MYASIEEQVRAIRGLEAKRPVDPKIIDDAGIRKLAAESFRKDNPRELIAANERLLTALGLLEPSASLEDLYVDLLGSQIAGLYSPDDKQLYVVSRSGNLGPSQKVTFAHEYTHALQDQNFDLSGFELDTIGEGDRAIARLSLIEGDATLVMTLWQIDNLTQAELIQMLGEALNPEATRILEEFPPIIVKSLLFPYTSGLNFTQRLQGRGWEAVNAAFAKPPDSTEQILHPEKYDAGELPVAVDLPADLAARMGDGWSRGLTDRMGEFGLSVWLDEAGDMSTRDAATAAAGWGGDQVVLLDGPQQRWAVVMRTAWDTAQDAAEFESAVAPVVQGLDGSGAVFIGAGGTERWIVLASNDQGLQRLANVLGLAG